ncbi:hypothetical protein Golob_006022 [Gossypium lobatum]|uniref:Uncharacterized protein n=1 Tax=Gossypium lobatum TaxID=34289 RepID=A0A7J8MVF0_9ROSI|nr:hypothetical protein [Gossypium lobatum]
MQLQLGLPVDGPVLTESAQSANWRAICYDLLGVIPDNIYEGQIEMGWLRDTFSEPGDDSTEVERIRYARAYILEIIEEQLANSVGVHCVVDIVLGDVPRFATKPINSAHTITGPNAHTSSDDANTTAPSDYAKCIS